MVVFTGSDSFPEETFLNARLQNVLLTSYVIDKYDEKIVKINFYTGQDN